MFTKQEMIKPTIHLNLSFSTNFCIKTKVDGHLKL